MKTEIIECYQCGVYVNKIKSEVRRSNILGRRLFCSRPCSAKAANLPRKRRIISITCPGCGDIFKTTTHNKAKKHCSRSCASKASMSESRRMAQRLGGLMTGPLNLRPNLSKGLLKREAWKYKKLEKVLQSEGRDFEFEYEIKPYVYDLALHDEKLLVEFDGKYHRERTQQGKDAEKDEHASLFGWHVVRKRVPTNTVIDPHFIVDL